MNEADFFARAGAKALRTLRLKGFFVALAAAPALFPALESAAQSRFTPPPAADFTFRRSVPPTDSRARRLVFPRGAGAAAARRPEPAAVAAFWQALEARPPGPARLAAAVEAAGTRPPPSRLARIFAAHGPAISAAARAHGLSPALLAAVILTESGGDPAAVSPKGAEGVMQLMPATARRFGVVDSYRPAPAIAGGGAYLSWLLGRFDGDAPLALAAWNAGEGAVERHGGVPPFAETRAFVPRVVAAFAAAGALCHPAPSAARDACTAPSALADR